MGGAARPLLATAAFHIEDRGSRLRARSAILTRALEVAVLARVDDDLFAVGHEGRYLHDDSILECGRLVGRRGCRALHHWFRRGDLRLDRLRQLDADRTI